MHPQSLLVLILFCYLSMLYEWIEVPIHVTFTLVNVAWYLRYSASDIIVVSLVPQLLYVKMSWISDLKYCFACSYTESEVTSLLRNGSFWTCHKLFFCHYSVSISDAPLIFVQYIVFIVYILSQT